MKRILTYGTFDLLHEGHLNLLRRAKLLGDYLIVGVTSDNYDRGRGKLNVCNSLIKRIEDVRATGCADEIIVEEYEGQKIDDIHKYRVDVFAIGSDWIGKFDYLKEYCEVVYLERTKGVSSTMLRGQMQTIVDIGIIGSGRIASRFVKESKYVSGVNVKGVYNPNRKSADAFCEEQELAFSSDDLDVFLQEVEAVYIASPHLSHAHYIKCCIDKGKHVLCEKPMVLLHKQAEELFSLARTNRVVLQEAIKTAYCPGFIALTSMIKSGAIGRIVDVDASFTKLVDNLSARELSSEMAGGSVTELASYPLFAIFKFLGTNYERVEFFSDINNEGVDLFTRGIIVFPGAVASFKVGLGVKTEGNLVISGTKGYAYVPSPWWKTEYFELRYEDLNHTKKYFYKFDDDGLRYEIYDFITSIKNNSDSPHKLTERESVTIARIIETHRLGENLLRIR